VTPPAWSLRAAGEDDADALALVGAATFLESFAAMLDTAAILGHCARVHTPGACAALLRAGAAAWLAEAAPAGAPIGYAILTEPDLPGAGAADRELRRIYAFSRWHGAGVGAALLAAAIAEAARRGAARLMLGVHEGNARALAFYARQGFVPVGTRRFRVGDRLCDDRVLARPLP
jgi:diamine N-acetyltransferase